MDSWSKAQILKMQQGGNEKMLQWFAKHNIARNLSIQEKYNTPEAELYRLRLDATVKGETPPDELPESSKKAYAASRGNGARTGETPVERELRLRREAGGTLRAKFGKGGLKGSSVGNSAYGYNPRSRGGSGSNPTLDNISTMFSSFTTAAAELASNTAESIRKAEIGKRVKDSTSKIGSSDTWKSISEATSSGWSALSNNTSSSSTK